MGVRTKTLVTFLLVGTVVGVFALQVQNKELLQGNIELNPEITENDPVDMALPDLTSELKVDRPEVGNEDIIVTATIKNIGEGRISSEEGFMYTIYVNDVDVLTNTDSFTTIEPGDSFSFSYPVPRKIYPYADTGNVRFVVDRENELEESNENNNEISVDYDFS